MTPEIKAAIKKEAESYCNKPYKNGEYPLDTKGCKIDFKAGAEFGYKLAEQQINDSERNYQEMFKTMTASVGGYKARLDIVVTALKAIINHELYEGVNQGADTVTLAQRALKELGE